MKIETVLGSVDASQLGRTLTHEHIFVSFPGSEFDPLVQFDRAGLVQEAVKRLTELRVRCGVRTFVDPCPIELGRDVELMREVSEKAEMHVVCTTGFYHEELGVPPYWRKQSADEIARLYVHEITKGIGSSGARAGLIKYASGAPAISHVETKVAEAACIAQRETGVSILTHTDKGLCGPEQQVLFSQGGVLPHRCLIGHSCGNPDHAYHHGIAKAGSYVGFDRIGMLREMSDAVRADNVARLVRSGYGAHVILSQDGICGYRGKLVTMSKEDQARLAAGGPRPLTHLFDVFIPMLKARGLEDGEISSMLEDNPRRFLSGESIPAPLRQESAFRASC